MPRERHDRDAHCEAQAEALLRRAYYLNSLLGSDPANEKLEHTLLRDLLELVRQQGKVAELKVLTQKVLEAGVRG